MNQPANFLSHILLDALEDENETDVYNILEKNNVNASYVPHERGISPLHYACGMDNERLAVDFTRRFLETGSNPNVRSEENMTPLHVAAIYGRVEIVQLLLEHNAQLDVADDERKTPLHYAIEECHFEVVQIIRDYIFEDKFKRKQQKPLSETRNDSRNRFDQSLDHRTKSQHQTSTPPAGRSLVAVCNTLNASENNKYTPNRINYNYDVTSPYYINITHRRHQPQPKFGETNPPTALQSEHYLNLSGTEQVEIEKYKSTTQLSSSPEMTTRPVNIFTLTKDHLQELSHIAPEAERSRVSLIETWRDKVQRSRIRNSILKQYDDIDEMIDNVMENEHLNFTNTVLNNKPKKHNKAEPNGVCGSSSMTGTETTETAVINEELPKRTIGKMSLGKIIQKIAQAHLVDMEPDRGPKPVEMTETETSYHTVPEIKVETKSKEDTNLLQVPKVPLPENPNADSLHFIRSPKSADYFLQMTEAYVHTDDENGLVFYETKLLSNHGNKVSQQRSPVNGIQAAGASKINTNQRELETTITTQSTNITLPLDYETDALRAELTTFGEAPGPITKSTKRLYIKRLIKYKRNTDPLELKTKSCSNETKFSVELCRTVRSMDSFERITDYMKYEKQSSLYFANNQNKKKMREGHLKQSFIYMLIDPRISCNLPGESVFLEKFNIWKRFLQSIFYVGKGKTSRPYSHLYDAMKMHSRMHNTQANKALASNGKKISIKKQPLNIELFKSPPKKSSDSKKLDRILDIWGNGFGVVCLHVFHNIVPVEAYTREAAVIDALGMRHLTNVKRGDYYGAARTWTMKEKKFLGIALLFKAMQIYLAEGESQLSPSDLI